MSRKGALKLVGSWGRKKKKTRVGVAEGLREGLGITPEPKVNSDVSSILTLPSLQDVEGTDSGISVSPSSPLSPPSPRCNSPSIVIPLSSGLTNCHEEPRSPTIDSAEASARLVKELFSGILDQFDSSEADNGTSNDVTNGDDDVKDEVGTSNSSRICDSDRVSGDSVSEEEEKVLFSFASCDSITSNASGGDSSGLEGKSTCPSVSSSEYLNGNMAGDEAEDDEDDDTLAPLPEKRCLPRKQVSFEDLCNFLPPPPLPLSPPPGQTERVRRPRSILKQVQYDGTAVPRTSDPPLSPKLEPPCPCSEVCLATAEVRHVDIQRGPDPETSVCVVLGTYNIVVCHHPECTAPNQDKPLLLCRQCDLDIHRKPEYSSHLVLDAPKKRKPFGSGVASPSTLSPVLSPVLPPASPGSASESESDQDQDSVDGIFIKRTEKCKTERTPSEHEKRLKRKRAVKKRSFSQQDGDGEDLVEELMANSSDAEGDCRDSSSEVKVKDGGQGQGEASDPGRPPIVRRMSKVVSDEKHFTLRFSEREEDATDIEVVVADKNLLLSDALMPILERRGLSLPNIDVYLADSKTPLPTNSNTSFLGGTTLFIAKKDDREGELRNKQSKQSSKAKSPARGGGRRDSLHNTCGGGLLEPPSKQRRASLQLPSLRDHLFPGAATPRSQDEPFGSLRGKKGLLLGDETYSLPSVSPQGTLNLGDGKRSRTQGKLSALFSPANKDREKLEQLQEILDSYTNTGLPAEPALLRIGQDSATEDESIFQTETHWSVVVEKTSSLSKKQHDQQEAIWELLQTELSYIRGLEVITEVFQNCLLRIQEQGLLNEIDSEKLFINVRELLSNNKTFWRDHMRIPLQKARETGELLNPSYMKMGFTKEFRNLFNKPYSCYCVGHKNAVEYMKARYNENELFKMFVVWAEAQKQCNRLKLTDLLVKPMQRLTKYPLLLQAILRKTEEERQRRDLLEMIASADNACSYVNQKIRQATEWERLEAIISKIDPLDAIDANTEECSRYIQEYNGNFNLRAPVPGVASDFTRSLVYHSALRMKEVQKVEVDCFLFTDLFLICKSSKRMDRYKIVKPPMRLDRIIVQELKDRGSFLLIYINEYHVPIMALTFHGDQTGVRVWLERIKLTQEAYIEARKQAEMRMQPLLRGHGTIMEEVTYTPLTPAPQGRGTFLRTQSEESVEERFVPNIVTTVASPPEFEQGQGHGDTGHHQQGRDANHPASLGRGRAESCIDLVTSSDRDPDDLGSEDGRLRTRDERSTASSPTRSPLLQHRPVCPSVSVPDILGSHAALRLPPEARMDISPLPGEDAARIKMAARRVSRTEKRYHTADSIRDIRREGRDASIHKRLSWNLGAGEVGEEGGHQPPRLQPADSTSSMHTSSGVSSSGSLQHPPDLNDSDLGISSPQHGPQASQDGEVGESGAQPLTPESRYGKSRSTPDLAALLSELKTGEEESGIVSVDLPPPSSTRKRLSHAEILKMKQLLLNSNVEASEV